MRIGKTAKMVMGCGVLAAACGLAQAAPDVIVGDIYDPQNYGAGSSVGGPVHVWAFGTYSCNVAAAAGTNKAAPYSNFDSNSLLWIDTASQAGWDTRNHPVISQNLYKLNNGRFEQIGQAWLKHGFCALQGTICSSCTPGGNCDALYPGCSDPYSGSLNGSQSGLGPKSEVNATSGVFPYPWVNNGSGSGTAFKRLQALDSELTSGAQYFFASQYVQPEDRQAGNANNSESYRRVTMDSPTWAATLADTTQRQKPAIQAWVDHGLGANQPDATVILTNVDVAETVTLTNSITLPNGTPQSIMARHIVGCKVTNTGPGIYHYEYAVQNLTSDRGSGSFSIPLPAGAAVSNIGFHDVAYHSGEPYDGTDWTGVASAASVTWSCPQTYAQNVNANALRFDTIYNFRFDCNRAPTTGTGTLGFFKPGSGSDPASATFSVQVPGTSTGGSGNDACADAQVVGSGTLTFDSTNATTDGPTECLNAGDDQIGKDVWYSWTNAGTCTGTATISTCGSSFDTKLAVYAACPTGPGTAIACNDDAGTCGTGSTVTFTATAAATYLIRVGGFDADGTGPGAPASGAGTVSITAPNCAPQPPANNPCAGAYWLSDGVAFSDSTTLATNDGTATCGAAQTSADVWFKYRPTTTGNVAFNLCGSGFDTVLAVYSGTCGSLTQLACNDDSGAAGPCAGSLQSYISQTMTANTTYYIRVAGYQGATGAYTITAVGGGGVAPPANDDCAGRAGIGAASIPFNTTAASTDGQSLASCGQIYNDVWFNYPAVAGDGFVTFDTCGAAFDSKLAVYHTAACATVGDATLLACGDSECGDDASVTLPIHHLDSYTVRVGGSDAAAKGAGTLHVTFVPRCPADLDDGSGTGSFDGGTDINDLLYFLAAYESGGLSADLDDGSGTGTPDGGVDINDLLFFLTHYEAGC